MSSIKWLDEESSGKENVDEQSAITLGEDTPSIRYYNTPPTFEALLSLENFYDLLSKSFVFIHNKKTCSDDFVDKLICDYYGNFEIKQIQTHQCPTSDLMQKIEKGLRAKKKRSIWIVESTSHSDNLTEFCTKLFIIKNDRHGIWIRGNLNELSPKTIQIFDVLFLFEMSSTEYDVFRTAILTPSDLAKQMVSQYGAMDNAHWMLTFINYKRLPRAPLLTSNPIILLTRNKEATYPMDITPFIPLIVKATEYIFTEAREYLTRERSGSGASDEEIIGLAITKQEFDKAHLNTDNFSSMIDASVTRADMYELKKLLEMITLQRKLVAQMKLDNILKNDSRLVLEIDIKEGEIAKNTLEMQELLKRLYKN